MNIKDLDLNLLAIFDVIYGTRNISHAADQLNMNQPTISNALARLRKQLDDPLFVRDGRRMAPTARAQEIIQPVRRALAEFKSLTFEEESFDPFTSKREFRIHMVSTLELTIMQYLSAKTQIGDGISYELIPFTAIDSETAVLTNCAEVAIGLTPSSNSELQWEELHPLEIVIMARKGNPLVKQGMSIKDSIELNYVIFNMKPTFHAPGSKAVLDKLVTNKQPMLHHTCKVNHEFEMAFLVATTDLVAVVPTAFAKSLPSWFDVEFHKCPTPGPEQPIYLIWKQNLTDDQGLNWLRKSIKNSIEQLKNTRLEIIE